jgi:hypothetical protein
MKRIDFATGKFTANGNEYIINDYLSIGRDVRFSNLVPKMAFGTDFKGIFKAFADIYKLATTGESPLNALHKIALTSINYMDAVKNIGESNYPVYYELCALFINRVGEPETITDGMIVDKIKDWEAEGLIKEDFFLLAINSINGLKSQWLELQAKLREETMR